MRKKKNAMIIAIAVGLTVAVAAITVTTVIKVSQKNVEKETVNEEEYFFEKYTPEEFAEYAEQKFGLKKEDILKEEIFENTDMQETMTREILCCAAALVTEKAGKLAEKFIPIDEIYEEGENTELFRRLYGNFEVTDKTSYSGLVLEQQKKQCRKITVTSYVYANGKVRTFYRYNTKQSEEAGILHGYSFPANDVEENGTEIVKYVKKAFFYGFAIWEYSEEKYEILMRPDEKITEKDIEFVTGILEGKMQPLYADVICLETVPEKEFSQETYIEYFSEKYGKCTCDTEYVYFATDYVPILYAAGVFSNDMNETGTSFLEADRDGTGLALWFGTESYGNICLPLNYCRTDPLIFSISPNDVSEYEKKTEIMGKILPETAAMEFMEKSNRFFSGKGENEFYAGGISCGYYKNEAEGYSLLIGTSSQEE